MKIKRISSFMAAFLMSLTSLFVLGVPSASAATRTWDGSSGDGKWSTPANWSSDTAPVNGDIVTFDMTVPVAYDTVLNNDISNLNIAGITLTGAGTTNKSFKITGNKLILTGGITENQTSGTIKLALDVTLGANLTYTSLVKHGVYFGSTDVVSTLDLATYSLTLDLGAEGCNGVSINSSLKGSGNITITTGEVNLTKAAGAYTGSGR